MYFAKMHSKHRCRNNGCRNSGCRNSGMYPGIAVSLNTEACRQAKELVTRVTPRLTQFALLQCRRDLRMLVYLLTRHNTLNRHLTIMRRVNNPLCPLCEEEDKTSLHFLGKCCATSNTHWLHFGAPFLEPGDLK